MMKTINNYKNEIRFGVILSLVVVSVIYSFGWYHEKEVTAVRGIKHYSGIIKDYSCSSGRRGALNWQIEFDSNRQLKFSIFRVYSECDEFLQKKLINHSQIIGAKFDGYFEGQLVLDLKINDIPLVTFQEVREASNGSVIFTSLGVTLFALIVPLLVKRNKLKKQL